MNNNQGRSQDFQRGGVDFLLKRAKQGASEASVTYAYFMRLFGTGVPGGLRGEAPEDIPFPCI